MVCTVTTPERLPPTSDVMVVGVSDPTTPEEARAQLRRLGIPDENLSDEQALKLLEDMIRAQVPAPPIPARDAASERTRVARCCSDRWRLRPT